MVKKKVYQSVRVLWATPLCVTTAAFPGFTMQAWIELPFFRALDQLGNNPCIMALLCKPLLH